METTIYEFQGLYRYLSNFYPLRFPITDEYGISYPTVEHAFQAAKTLDRGRRADISNRKTPSEAKKLGRTLSLRPDWEDVKVELMYGFLTQKFVLNEDLRIKLCATGSAQLIEGNTWGDRFWGICNGTGLNILGECLMAIREGFRYGTTRRRYSREDLRLSK
ncbi:MAG: NADAR family protein [Chloroflexi bacterium]|nr:MAG: NADAR family protein [Chloroflexota bacterium]